MGRKRHHAGPSEEWDAAAPSSDSNSSGSVRLGAVVGCLQLADAAFTISGWDRFVSKKKKRKGKGKQQASDDSFEPVLHNGVLVPAKFWRRRHMLWSLFDGSPSISPDVDDENMAAQQIRMDLEGWYSVTPEVVADHLTQTMVAHEPSTNSEHAGSESCTSGSESKGVVLDLFCGCGGNAISFARHPSVSRVVAVELDAARLAMARHNACVYGVQRKIEWVHGDAVEVLLRLLRAESESKPTKSTGGKSLTDKRTSASSFQADGAEGSSETDKASEWSSFLKATDLIFSRQNCQLAISLPAPAGAEQQSPIPVQSIFLAPPWGGMDYTAHTEFDVRRHIALPSDSAAALIAELRLRGIDANDDEETDLVNDLENPAQKDCRADEHEDDAEVDDEDDATKGIEAAADDSAAAMTEAAASSSAINGAQLLQAATLALRPPLQTGSSSSSSSSVSSSSAADVTSRCIGYYLPKQTSLSSLRAALDPITAPALTCDAQAAKSGDAVDAIAYASLPPAAAAEANPQGSMPVSLAGGLSSPSPSTSSYLLETVHIGSPLRPLAQMLYIGL